MFFFETQFMSSDNASPFDLNDELQERTTCCNEEESCRNKWWSTGDMQTPVEVGTSLSQDSERTLEVGTSSNQDAEERPRRNHVPNSSIFNKQFVVNQAAQCERGDPIAAWETLWQQQKRFGWKDSYLNSCLALQILLKFTSTTKELLILVRIPVFDQKQST